MADIRAIADQKRKTDTHNRLASELGRSADFDFEARRLVRNVAGEAFDIQSRVNHIFRNRDKMEWTEGPLTDLKAIIDRLEFSLKTAREVLAAAEAPTQFLHAAE